MILVIAMIMFLRTFKTDPEEELNEDYFEYPVIEQWDPLQII
jgi:hypothetical protein